MYNVKNNAKTELDDTIEDASTTISVPLGYGTLFPDGDFVVTVWNVLYASPGDDSQREIIYISTRSGDVLTIGARAQEGTSQVNHAIGDHIALLFTAGTWDQVVDYVDTNVTTEACTGAEIDTGTVTTKHATPKAIADSKLSYTDGVETLTSKTISTGSVIDANVNVVAVLMKVYPIGCIYTSTVSTNPATVFGFGTWVAFGSGKVLVGLNGSDADFDTSEETGGAKTATLSGANLPAHAHTVNPPSTTSYGVSNQTMTTGSKEALAYLGSGSHITVVRPVGYGSDGDVNLYDAQHTHNIDIPEFNSGNGPGSATAFSVMNPYIVVYFYKRTA